MILQSIYYCDEIPGQIKGIESCEWPCNVLRFDLLYSVNKCVGICAAYLCHNVVFCQGLAFDLCVSALILFTFLI